MTRDHKELIRVPPALADGYCLELSRLETIHPHAFWGCDGIGVLGLPGTVKNIYPEMIDELSGLRELRLGKGFSARLPVELRGKDGEILPPEDIQGHCFKKDVSGSFLLSGTYDTTKEDWVGYTYNDDDDDYSSSESTTVFEPLTVKGTFFKDIAGLQQAKDEIYRRLILPAKEPELFKRFNLESSTGMLLYGPPGTGKTMLARAVASELDAAFFSVKPSDILSRWVGGEEENIRKLFKAARKHERAVIFFDDFDALGKTRGNDLEPWMDELVTELLTQMQGIEKHDGTLLVLAATNRPWILDSALMRSGRFSVQISVPLPDADAREWIFRNRLSKIPISEEIEFRALADATEGYNGADIEEICNYAKVHRVEAIAKGDPEQSLDVCDIMYALGIVRSTVSEKDLRDLENYRLNGSAMAYAQYLCSTGPAEGYR